MISPHLCCFWTIIILKPQINRVAIKPDIGESSGFDGDIHLNMGDNNQMSINPQ
jgi:hypothetical protein